MNLIHEKFSFNSPIALIQWFPTCRPRLLRNHKGFSNYQLPFYSTFKLLYIIFCYIKRFKNNAIHSHSFFKTNFENFSNNSRRKDRELLYLNTIKKFEYRIKKELRNSALIRTTVQIDETLIVLGSLVSRVRVVAFDTTFEAY